MTFRLYIDPADTMIFRDGRPFNQDDAGRASAASLFPPPPVALYGAARVAIARALGWDGIGDWTKNENISNVVGSWRDPKGFRIAGPFFQLTTRSTRGGPPASVKDLLPIPANVVASVDTKKDKEKQEVWHEHIKKIKVLVPTKERIATDLDDVRLLDPGEQGDGHKDEPLSTRWALRDVVERLLRTGERPTAEELAGPEHDDWRKLPKQRLPGWGAGDLADEEQRVGIERDTGTRLVEEGMLYVSTRRRLRPNVRLYVDVEVEGMAADMEAQIRNALSFALLGGESRFAFLDSEHDVGSTGSAASSAGPAGPPLPLTRKTYIVYFTTPVVMPPPQPNKPVQERERQKKLPGILVSAAFTAPYAQPGLQNEKANHVSASTTVLPAGTVFFMRNGQGAEVPASGRLGEATHMGYGRYLTGVWNDG